MKIVELDDDCLGIIKHALLAYKLQVYQREKEAKTIKLTGELLGKASTIQRAEAELKEVAHKYQMIRKAARLLAKDI